MVNSELFEALELIEKEKGIPKAYMLEKIEAALISAFRKDYGTSDNVSVLINEAKRDIKLIQKRTVVEEVQDDHEEISLVEAQQRDKRLQLGDVVEEELKPKEFGRISAQTAKQVIIQGIREGERELLFDEYTSKEHEILTGVVRKVDPRSGNVTLELGKSEAVLVAGEQIPGERYREGDRVKVYVLEVKKNTKGVQIMISRTHPGLVKRLFELEVSEIYDGTVEIKSIAREAGSRTKIAVSSNDENVDPIGACIGSKGARVASIVAELGGEKVDIIKYNTDPLIFIAAALAPAEALRVEPGEGEKSCIAIVPDDQLSLAIGKEGQNARLAAKLTGWKIDIKPESQA